MLPAVLAISVALLTRKIFLGLGIGVVAGALVAQGGDPGGSLTAIYRYLFSAVFDQSHAAIVIFSFLVAATANILTDSGAVTALILRLGNLSGRRRSLMGTSWLAGLVVFFDDYANCLIVGKSFAPIYDRCKISREKLAYIVDSTAAPIASIAIISTWIGFELDLIDKALKGSQASGSAFSVFLQSIPFRFYSIFTLAFVACIAFTGRDFGAMAGVELKASRRLPSQRDAQEPAPNPRLAWLALTAIGLLVLSTVATLVFSGWSRTVSAGGSATVLEIVGNSDPFQAILVGSTVAFLFAVLSSLKLKLHSIHRLLLSVGGGFHSILGALTVLYLAWTLGNALEEAGTATYFSSLLQTTVPAWILPSLSFLLAAGTSFSTGSSFGTMGILIPIILPLGVALGSTGDGFILYAATGSVLAGASLGDHMSPLSDTTVLSAAGAGVDVVSHTRTQLPYACTVGTVALLLGYLPVGLGVSPWVLIPCGVAACLLVIRFLGRPLPSETKEKELSTKAHQERHERKRDNHDGERRTTNGHE